MQYIIFGNGREFQERGSLLFLVAAIFNIRTLRRQRCYS